jgi:filamentous hemagglutinin family protein
MKKILFWVFQASFVACCSLITHNSVTAQPITSDGTLAQPTEVNPTDAGVEINGGTVKGGNLFHSFNDFSVPAGLEAHFNNNTDVVNILNRVTGGNVSQIDGLIRANGGANLFLINPAGIIFGSNARLDIGGSFFGTTADSLLFDNGGEFSATDPQAKPILTINAPIGLNLRDNPQPISNQSTAKGVGLEVQPGKNITLVGGELNFNGGILTAPGGRIELGGLSTTGEIDINSDGNLTFPDSISRADVTFTNGAEVNVAANGGGFINVNARNLTLSQESQLLAGIAENNGKSNAQAGNITLDATNAIALKESSSISNQVNLNSIGNAGNIEISSNTLNLADSSFISSSTFGEGDGGDITINTLEDLSIKGEGRLDPNDNSPGIAIASAALSPTKANAGNITINAGSFSLTDFTSIDASNLSLAGGNAGNVVINAGNDVLISESGINSLAGFGNAGNIEIKANSIHTGNYSFVDSSNLATGNSGDILFQANSIFMATPFIRSQIVDGEAGDINVFAQDSLQIDGTGASASGITVESLGSGNGGNINIKAKDFAIANGAVLNAVANNTGNGGKIAIDANTININQALINASSFGIGRGGDIQIQNAESVEIIGSGFATLQENIITQATQDPTIFENFDSANVRALGIQGILAATIGSEGTAAGNITIDTTNLNIKEGGVISTATTGGGGAGNIVIDSSGLLEVNEGLISSATVNTGQAGDVELNIAELIVEGGGQITASSLAAGDGGNLTINATKSVKLDGTDPSGSQPSSLLVGSQLTSGTGDSGNLKLTSPQLTISNGAMITASTLGTGTGGNIEIMAADFVNLIDNAKIAVNSQGQGDAGELKITTNDLTLANQSSLSAETVASNGGNIQLNVLDSVFLQENSVISTTAGSEGMKANGGNIEINADFVVATPSENSDITANAFQGKGGAIEISTQGIFGITQRDLNPNANDINASSQLGVDGNITIQTIGSETFQETAEPPATIVESEGVVARICDPAKTAENILAGTENTLTIKERPIPPQPIDPLMSDNILLNAQSVIGNEENGGRRQVEPQEQTSQEPLSPILTAQGLIYPAQGIVRQADGTVILTAHRINPNQRIPSHSRNCG